MNLPALWTNLGRRYPQPVLSVDPDGAFASPAGFDPTDLIASVNALGVILNTLATHTDATGLAALSTALNGYVDGLEGFVDGLETLIGSSNTKLDSLHTDLATTLAGYVDGLEGLLGKLTDGTAISKDGGYAQAVSWGVSGAPVQNDDVHTTAASITDAPTSAQKICIDEITFSVETACQVTFRIETAGTVVYGPFYMPANSTYSFIPRAKLAKLATADKKLQIKTDVASKVMAYAAYHSEA